MKAVVIDQGGSADAFREAEVARPEINPDQVLIEVHAAVINPVDVAIREGQMGDLDYPAILASDIAGIVTKIGENVTNLKLVILFLVIMICSKVEVLASTLL